MRIFLASSSGLNGFWMNCPPASKDSVVLDDVIGVPGHEQHLDAGLERLATGRPVPGR